MAFNQYNKQLGITVSAEMNTQVRELARVQNTSVSDLVRRAIVLYLEVNTVAKDNN